MRTIEIFLLTTHFSGPEPEDELERMAYFCRSYTKVICFLRGFQSFYQPNIKAKFLLNYEQYLLYIQFKNIDPQFDQETFYLYSKQCWIDLILQILKVFVLTRFTLQPALICSKEYTEEEGTESGNASYVENEDIDEEENEDIDFSDLGLYGPHEKMMIAWLDKHYEDQRKTLWTKDDIPDKKELLFLDEDLSDGLVLASVTAAYCPYAKEFLEDMYTHPMTPEEYFHNACRLVQTWQYLKLSYYISPHTIVCSNVIEMLLLISYLYDVLPSCSPQEVITIEAPLTQNREGFVSVQNCGTSPIVYHVLFFGNEDGLFTVAKQKLDVAPGKTKKLKVVYHAKKIHKINATLLLSGESPGHKYCKCLAVGLEGNPDRTFAIAEIPITVNLYKMCIVTLVFDAPFQVAANYNIYLGKVDEGDDKAVSNINVFPYEELQNIKICREYICSEEVIGDFDESGKNVVKPKMCCLVPGMRAVWVYFAHPVVGDWAVKLLVTGKMTRDCYEEIDVLLPKNYDSIPCLCKKGISFIHKCPKIVYIKIPRMNNLLWNARKNLILESVSGEALDFWNTRICKKLFLCSFYNIFFRHADWY